MMKNDEYRNILDIYIYMVISFIYYDSWINIKCMMILNDIDIFYIHHIYILYLTYMINMINSYMTCPNLTA